MRAAPNFGAIALYNPAVTANRPFCSTLMLGGYGGEEGPTGQTRIWTLANLPAANGQ
jgi:hypothetical protein